MRFNAQKSFHLGAAQDWLELGNITEANEELEKIEASLRGHPDVLEVRWRSRGKGRIMFLLANS